MGVPIATVESYVRHIEKLRARVDALEYALFFLAGDCEALHGEVLRGFNHTITEREAMNLATAKALVADYEPDEQ